MSLILGYCMPLKKRKYFNLLWRLPTVDFIKIYKQIIQYVLVLMTRRVHEKCYCKTNFLKNINLFVIELLSYNGTEKV